MKFFAIRHAITKHNKLGIINGQAVDEPLELEGFEQAKLAATQIPPEISRIYSSDMLRTRQTADTINNLLNLPISYHPELREVHFGKYSGLSWDDITKAGGEAAHQEYRDMKYDFTSHGGESFEGVKSRLEKILNELKARHAEEQILLVTHGAIVRHLYYILDKERRDKIDNVSIHEFEV